MNISSHGNGVKKKEVMDSSIHGPSQPAGSVGLLHISSLRYCLQSILLLPLESHSPRIYRETSSQQFDILNHYTLKPPEKPSATENPVMSNSIMETWMVPDNEYYAETEDYALVGESAKLIRVEIDEANNFVAKPPSKPICYSDILRLHRDRSAYQFSFPGSRMIYADVDDSNPDHERIVKNLRKTQQKLDYKTHDNVETIGDSARDARKAFGAYLVDTWKGRYPPDSVAETDMDAELFDEWKRGQVLDIFHQMDDHTVVPHILDFIVGAGHEYRKELMDIVSGQELYPNKRPVMLLIEAIDALQCRTPGIKEGWAVAYDVVKQQIVIKPFSSDKDRHPLTSSWSAPITDDGLSFRCSPMQFIKGYTELAKSVEEQTLNGEAEVSEKHLKFQDSRLSFRMLVHTLVIKWVFTHERGLISHWCETPEEASDILKNAKEAYHKIKGYLALIPFAMQEKSKIPENEKKTVITPFEELEWSLVEMEDYFRNGAVEAKEIGENKIAENIAVLYERILGMVQSFNKDPRGDL